MIIIKYIKNYFHFIISFSCVLFWALFLLIKYEFIIPGVDFDDRHLAGYLLLHEPSRLYTIRYYYLPSFATFLLIPFSLLPLITAKYLSVGINVLMLILNAWEYDKILYLKGIKNNFHRTIFLLLISNGYVVFANFYHNNFKFVSSLLILLVLRREIEYSYDEKFKSLKFYFINFNCLWLAIAIIPQLVFIIFIYLFYSIPLKEILKIECFKLYGLASLAFLLQNFMFLVHPHYIYDFLNSYKRNNSTQRPSTIPFCYTKEWLYVENNSIYFTISVIMLSITTLILILSKNFSIEYKLAIFSYGYLFYGAWASRAFTVIIPLSYLLFLPWFFRNKSEKESLIIKIFLYLGILSLFGIYMMFPNFTFFKYLPFSEDSLMGLLVNLRWIFLLLLSLFSLIIIYHEKLNKLKVLKYIKLKFFYSAPSHE